MLKPIVIGIFFGFCFSRIMLASEPVGLSPYFSYQKALKAYENAHYDDALNRVSDMISKGDASSEVYMLLGNIYYRQNQFEFAEKAYQTALNLSNAQVRRDALYNLGTTYLGQKNWNKAIETFKEVLRSEPKHLLSKQNLEWALRQQKAEQQASSSSSSSSSSSKAPDKDRSGEGKGDSMPDGTSEGNDQANSSQRQSKPVEMGETDRSQNQKINAAKQLLNLLSEQEKQVRRSYRKPATMEITDENDW